MNRLEEILEGTLRALAQRKARVSAGELEVRAARQPAALSMRGALSRGEARLSVIAEVKRSSPSAGPIVTSLDPVAQALSYVEGGAAAISVLTDQEHFGGSLEDLSAVCAAQPGVPVLRKDFIVDDYQLLETRAAGADAVLLLAALHDAPALASLLARTGQLGMEGLVEAHSEEELEVALASGAQLIGINNRDLRTLEVSLQTTVLLGPRVPDDRLLVAESGIATAADAARVCAAGARAVLVGEALMRSGAPAALVRELRVPLPSSVGARP